MKTRTLLMAVAGALTLAGTSADAAPLFAAEFNADGDYGGFVEFSDRLDGDTVTAASGTLSGVANSNDPQLRIGNDAAPLDLDLTLLDTITMRIRVSLANDGAFADLTSAGGVEMRWGFNPYVSTHSSTMGNTAGAGNIALVASSVVADGDGFYVFTYDVSGLTAPTDPDSPDDLDSLRVDPVSATPGAAVDVDYIRINAVPEPGSLALLGLGGLLIARRRRG